MQKITTFLTFKERGEEAMNFYVSLFPDSKVISAMSHEGQLLHGQFQLDGQIFYCMDGGAGFDFALGTSLFVNCDTQDEVDELWEKLSSGGEKGKCGWLKDKYGLSWQIIPSDLGRLMQDSDPDKSARVMQAMLKMTKIDIEKLHKAYEGE